MKQKIPYILFLFSTLFAHSQVTLAVSDVKDAKLNQRFNLTVVLEISGENMEQETPLRMPDLSKFDIIGTASEQNTVVLDAKKGDVVNQMIYQLVLTPKQSGKVKFGSVLVTVNGKIYKTEPFEINVRDTEKKTSVATNSETNDLYLNLEIQDREVYKNEATLAFLRAYSRNYANFRKLKNIQFSNQRNVSIKPVSFAKSEIESSGGMNSQVIAVYMISPSESGHIELNPVSASVVNSASEDKIVSNRAKLTVRKLPPGMPEHYKNAVGHFEVTVANLRPNEVSEIEKPVNVALKLSGAGNFGTLYLPKILPSPNYIAYPPKIMANTTPHHANLTGDVVAEYVVVPKKPGLVAVAFEEFSYFDPSADHYVDLGSKSVALNVKTPDQINAEKSTLERVNDITNNVLETVNTPVLQTHNLKIKDKKKINWPVVAGNFVLLSALVGLLFAVTKRKQKQRVKPRPLIIPTTTIAETEELIRKDWENSFEDNIIYLKKLKDNQDFSTFFSAYESMKEEVKKQNSIIDESAFRKFLEEKKGAAFADQYRVLSEQIQFEKYAPENSIERVDELFSSITTLFSQIKK